MHMKISSRMMYRTAVVLLGLMLALGLLVAVNGATTQKASAVMTPAQWENVRSFIDAYYGGSQYNAGLDGEAGFRMGKIDLWNRLDSNGNISPNAGAGVGANGVAVTGVLGEGDDMANRPVLIDNLRTQTNMIPGTEFRCNWNANEDCFADASITAIRQIVDNHEDAGFSTDIVDYCVSSQTAGPSTGGFGIIAQTGALKTSAGIPNVYVADYSRNGWRNNLSTASGTGLLAAPEASAGGYSAPTTTAECDGEAPGYDLVRCRANWAISSTGGNVGNGTSTMSLISGAGQSVDIRNGTINTIDTAGTNLQVPINTLFSTTGLANLNPLASTTMVTRTQMGATASIGLEMLAYDNVLNGANINAGISRWNGSEGEAQVAYGDGLPTQSVGSYGAPAAVDTGGPSVSSVGSSNVTGTTADIDRVAGEPATMKVKYGTTSGGPYTNEVNNTVLNASKTVGLSGLTPGTTYYVQATSYDGHANGTVSSEISFTTCGSAPELTLSIAGVAWGMGGYPNYLDVSYLVSNGGVDTAYNVQIDTSSATNGVTLNPPSGQLPAVIGTIVGGGSGGTVLTYSVPVGVGSFWVSNTASADDQCSVNWTYP